MTKMRLQLPAIHALVMGEGGSGKTTFAVSWPKPMLVWFWDAVGKDLPYKKQALDVVPSVNTNLYPYEDVQRADGPVRIEHYRSLNPQNPDAYDRFLKRMSGFHNEYDVWKTVVVDCATSMELEARKWHQYKLNPTTREPRQWFAGSTDMLEEFLLMRLGNLPMNVVVLAHIDEDKDELHGEIVRNPNLPGRLRKRASTAFAEQYRVYVVRNEEGKIVRQIQTDNDGRYACQSQIGAPNPCWPLYDSLWENWQG